MTSAGPRLPARAFSDTSFSDHPLTGGGGGDNSAASLASSLASLRTTPSVGHLIDGRFVPIEGDGHVVMGRFVPISGDE